MLPGMERLKSVYSINSLLCFKYVLQEYNIINMIKMRELIPLNRTWVGLVST